MSKKEKVVDRGQNGFQCEDNTTILETDVPGVS